MSSSWRSFWERYRAGLTLRLLVVSFIAKFIGAVALGNLLEEWIVFSVRGPLVIGALLVWIVSVCLIWKPSGWAVFMLRLLSVARITLGILGILGFLELTFIRPSRVGENLLGPILAFVYLILFGLPGLLEVLNFIKNKVAYWINVLLSISLSGCLSYVVVLYIVPNNSGSRPVLLFLLIIVPYVLIVTHLIRLWVTRGKPSELLWERPHAMPRPGPLLMALVAIGLVGIGIGSMGGLGGLTELEVLAIFIICVSVDLAVKLKAWKG